MSDRIANEHHAACLKRWAMPCILAMRKAARLHGYALATHGTLAFDIDVVAVPWMEDAATAEELIPALRSACSEVTGLPTMLWGLPDLPEEHQVGDDALLNLGKKPEELRPHGRIAWSWQLGGGAYVDCSVMPLKEVTNV